MITDGIKEQHEKLMKDLHKDHPIDELVKFDDTNIQEKLSNNTFLIVKYKDLYLREKSALDQLIIWKEEQVCKVFQEKRNTEQGFLKTSEIEKYYIPNDPKIKKLNKLILQQGWRVEFFEMCVNALNQQGWRMKSFLDSNKAGF